MLTEKVRILRNRSPQEPGQDEKDLSEAISKVSSTVPSTCNDIESSSRSSAGLADSDPGEPGFEILSCSP